MSTLFSRYLRLREYLFNSKSDSVTPLQIRIAYEWTEDFVIKYLWSAAGYLLISIPVLFTRRLEAGPRVALAAATNAVADRTESA
jgi:hypothetical protein